MTPKVLEKNLLNLKVYIRTLQDKRIKIIISFRGPTKQCHEINWLFEVLNCGQLDNSIKTKLLLVFKKNIKRTND